MSSHNSYRLVLSEDAQDDLEGILMYTYRQWGEGQQIKYADMLNAAVIAIRDNPSKGFRHPKLSDEYRTYHAGRHYIVYRVEGQEVQVVRILHDHMDILRHVN